jgi:sortase A
MLGPETMDNEQGSSTTQALLTEEWLQQPHVELQPVRRRLAQRRPRRSHTPQLRALKRGLDKAIDTLIVLVLVLFVLALGFWIYDTYIDPLLRRMNGAAPPTVRGSTSLWPGAGQLSSPEEASIAPLPYVAVSSTVQLPGPVAHAPTPAPGTEMPEVLEIPAIGLRTDIVEVTIADGIWQVAEYAAGYHRGTARPGTVGNTVISGHKGLAGAVFAHLEDVRLGDLIYVTAGTHEYRYQVIEKVSVWPTQVEVMAPTSIPVLTLITCTAYDTQRLVVVARLIQGYPTGMSAMP